MGKSFPFIVIEGIDGAGKTVTAKLLSEMVGANYYKTPSGHFGKLRANADYVFRNDPQKRFKFYFNSVKFASSEIIQIIQKNPVICDRYIWSTVVYHKAMGLDLSNFDIDRSGIVIPQYAFSLYADEETCRRRIRERNDQSASDLCLEQDLRLQQRVRSIFLKYPLIQIDTSNLTILEICKKILSIVCG